MICLIAFFSSRTISDVICKQKKRATGWLPSAKAGSSQQALRLDRGIKLYVLNLNATN
jgi:hypothetical protein